MKKYKVKFYSFKGFLLKEFEVEKDSLIESVSLDIAGFEFLGWYQGRTIFDFNTPVTKHINLVAKLRDDWSSKKVEINNVTYKLFDNKTASIFKVPNDAVDEFIIPSEIVSDNITYKVTTLGIHSFDHSKITKLIIPNSILFIQGEAFRFADKLKEVTLPTSIPYLADGTFFGCSSLESIDIPGNIKSIDRNCFRVCSSLKTVNILAGVEVIKEYIFYECKSLETVIIPDTVTKMGINVFEKCTSLKHIALSKNLKILSECTFINCCNLQSVVLPEILEKLEKKVFFGCTNLSEINFPDTLVEIGAWTFVGCKSLKNIKIPQNVLQINSGVFTECASLEEIYIHKDVNLIKGTAFDQCYNLKNIIINEDNQYYKVKDGHIFSYDETEFVRYIELSKTEVYSIPKSVTKVLEGSFHYIRFIRKLIFHEGIEVVTSALSESDAIVCFTPLKERPESWSINCYYLVPVNLLVLNNDGTKKIQLINKSITPAKLISKYVYKGVIYDRYTDGTAHVVGIEANAVDVEVYNQIICDDEEYTVTDMKKHIPNPDTLKKLTIGSNITIIPNYFITSESLEEVILPPTIIELGEYAFDKCTLLVNITIPESVSKIGNCSFSGCTSLKSINIPKNVNRLNASTFSGCSSLEDVKLHDEFTSIGIYTFKHCTSLKSIVLPQQVNVISSGAFDGCTSLENVELSSETRYIFSSAFYGCKSLKQITIPNTVIEIGARAFGQCTSLTNIVLPKSVEKLEEKIFAGSLNLTVYTEHTSKPGGWHNDFNYDNLFVMWGTSKVEKSYNKANMSLLEYIDSVNDSTPLDEINNLILQVVNYKDKDVEKNKSIKYKGYTLGLKYNNPTAMYHLGLLYLEGTGVSKNFKKGYTLITDAAKLGSLEAQYKYGYLTIREDDLVKKECGPISKESLDLALSYFEDQVSNNNADALLTLAMGYLYNDNPNYSRTVEIAEIMVSKNIKFGMELKVEATNRNLLCEQREMLAKYKKSKPTPYQICEIADLAEAYYLGKDKDGNKVYNYDDYPIEFAQYAYEQGNVLAKCIYGTCLCIGKGIKTDKTLGFKLVYESYEQGCPFACGMLAYLYEVGYGCDKDSKKAFEFAEKGIKLDDGLSYGNLASFYEEGINCDIDLDKAKELYHKAIELKSNQEKNLAVLEKKIAVRKIIDFTTLLLEDKCSNKIISRVLDIVTNCDCDDVGIAILDMLLSNDRHYSDETSMFVQVCTKFKKLYNVTYTIGLEEAVIELLSLKGIKYENTEDVIDLDMYDCLAKLTAYVRKHDLSLLAFNIVNVGYMVTITNPSNANTIIESFNKSLLGKTTVTLFEVDNDLSKEAKLVKMLFNEVDQDKVDLLVNKKIPEFIDCIFDEDNPAFACFGEDENLNGCIQDLIYIKEDYVFSKEQQRELSNVIHKAGRGYDDGIEAADKFMYDFGYSIIEMHFSRKANSSYELYYSYDGSSFGPDDIAFPITLVKNHEKEEFEILMYKFLGDYIV